MINFPVFEHLAVNDYRLFPGTPDKPGINFEIKDGISILAGINGLGKTTLINMLLRLLVGPFELPKMENAAKFGATARVREVTWPQRREYFSRRVADRAKAATASLRFAVGEDVFSVQRSLSDCRLLSATLNGTPIVVTDASETAYKAELVRASGLGSFVDLLTVVKFLTFFNEERMDILWDDQAQRQFFRILFSSPDTSTRWVKLEAEIGSADSSARNASVFATRLERDIKAMEEALTDNAGVSAELAAAQKLLDADLERKQELEEEAAKLRDEITSLARQVERAKLKEDDTQRALEELRYTALGRLFPNLDDTAQYILTHLFANGNCLACGADAHEEVERLNNALDHGTCAICGAAPGEQHRAEGTDKIVAVHQVEQKKLDLARTAQANAKIEREATEEAEQEKREALRAVNNELDTLTRAINERRLANSTLRARLPPDPQEVADKRRSFENAKRTEREYELQRAEAERKYHQLLAETEEQFRRAAVEVTPRFQKLARAFLEEECALTFRLVRDRPSQNGGYFMYPSLKFEMTAAAFETAQIRERPDDVSESQREFVDLAFRMALIETASLNQAASLVIETPEASLDAIFMQKAGNMLRQFAGSERNIIVTSNLTSSVMVPALLGGATEDAAEIGKRRSRVLDLLTIAAPNAAARRFSKEYSNFLELGIRGLVA